MTDQLFFDTNILVYVLDPTEQKKREKAADLVRIAIETSRFVVSPQTLNECYRVLTVKRKLVHRSVARRFIGELVPFCSAPLNAETTQMAFALEDRVRASWWDCLMLASALQSGCRGFLSEDMQHGRDIEGMTILNPFATHLSAIMG